MDQVLKDVMIDLADEDSAAGMDGMQGREGEQELAEIMAKIYKVRPFGEKAINMRELNPGGKHGLNVDKKTKKSLFFDL